MTQQSVWLSFMFAITCALFSPWHDTVGAAPKTALAPPPLYSCVFSPQGWDAKDWMFIRRRDMDNTDEWLQKQDCLENKDGGPNGQTSMLYNTKFKGDLVVTCTMAFSDRLAPCIELASKLVEDAKGRKEYDEQIEVVLWHEGINVWCHHTDNGKETWKLMAYSKFPLQRNTKYKLQVTKKGKDLSIDVAGHVFGYVEESLGDEIYVGLTGCEGINRFYDFSVRTVAP